MHIGSTTRERLFFIHADSDELRLPHDAGQR
jgi:hypothetical protein